MSRFNFDEFERDLDAAENYLKESFVKKSAPVKATDRSPRETDGKVTESWSKDVLMSSQDFGDTLFFASDLADTVEPSTPLDQSSNIPEANNDLIFNSSIKSTNETPKKSDLESTVKRGSVFDRYADSEVLTSMEESVTSKGESLANLIKNKASTFPVSSEFLDIPRNNFKNTVRLEPKTLKSLDIPNNDKATSQRERSNSPSKDSVQSAGKYQHLKTKSELLDEADRAFHSVFQFKPHLYTEKYKRQGAVSHSSMHPVEGPYLSDFSQKQRNEISSSQQSSDKRSVSPTTKRFIDMQDQYKRSLVARDKQREMNEKLEIMTHCTFTPKLCRKSREIVHKKEVEARGRMEAGRRADMIEKLSRSTSPSTIRDTALKSVPKLRRPASATPATRLAGEYEDELKYSKKLPKTRSASPVEKRPSVAVTADPAIENTLERVKSGELPLKSASQRLYRDAQVRADSQRWLKLQVEAARDAQYSYQPTINSNSSDIVNKQFEYKPIHERIGDLRRSKQNSLFMIRQSLEDEWKTSCTFTPVINRKIGSSEREKENSSDQVNTSVSDRLIAGGASYLKHRKELIVQKDQYEADVMRLFQPKVSKTSEAILKSSSLGSSSFLDRQEMDQQYRRSHAVELQRKLEEIPSSGSGKRVTSSNTFISTVAQHTAPPALDASKPSKYFKPNLSLSAATSEAYRAQSASRVRMGQYMDNQWEGGPEDKETTEERVLRISLGAAAQREENIREIERRVYGSRLGDGGESGCSFKPKIDPISKQLGRQSSIQELSENRRGRKRFEELQKKVQEQINKECSFHPKIYTKSSESECVDIDGLENERTTINMQEPERMARDIRFHLREKEQKRRIQLAEQEIDELKDCTFQPDVSFTKGYRAYSPRGSPTVGQAAIDSPSTMIVVRGLNRHMQLQKLAEKLKFDRENREKEVFTVQNVGKYRREEDNATIIKPFSLSSNVRHKSPAYRHPLLGEFAPPQGESFAPVTNDSQRRDVIRRIVNSVLNTDSVLQ